MKKRYYFITYQAKRRGGIELCYWQDITDKLPMQFILDVQEAEEEGEKNYVDFVVTNVHEITEDEYYFYQYSF